MSWPGQVRLQVSGVAGGDVAGRAVGRAAARARGRLGGRPAKLSPEQARLARARYNARDVTVAEITRALGVGRGTIYRALQQTP